jgi:rod shape determining protein RodA
MINFRMLKHSDVLLWIAAGLLILIGLLMIFSCTFSQLNRENGDALYYVKRQITALGVGFIGLCLFTYLDYRHLKTLAIAIYAVSLIVLFFVLFRGFTVLGAQRWVSLGPISFQPSEVSKLVLVIMLAAFLSDRRGEIQSILDLAMPLIILAVPFALIFKQPDLGTSIILFVIFTGLLVWAEASGTLLMLLVTPIISIFLKPNIIIWLVYLLGLFLYIRSTKVRLVDIIAIMVGNIGIGYAVPKAWGMLKEYQRARLLAFLNPENDPLGIGYHSLQAKIAIGSGGFFGKGYMHGTQTQLAFIPQQFTDFIFSAIGEELGFIGGVLVVGLFTVVLYRAVTLANESRDFFGSMLAAGIAVLIGFQMLINIGMTLGIMPVVGVPLPFISYGGTGLVVNMCALGILQSIAMRRHKLLF